MNPFLPPLITVFLGIFHLLGGGALGQGVRAALRGSDGSLFFIIWGAGMGGIPIIFDWFFLIAQGYLLFGLVGPILFLIAAFAGAFVEIKTNGPALISATLGSAAFLIGLFSIPLMLDRANEFELGTTDYLFGGCFALLFVLIGGGIAWNGFRAIVRGITLDSEYGEREQKSKRTRKGKSMGISIKKYWE